MRVWPRCFLPLPRLTGSCCVNTSFPHPCERFGATHQHKHFPTLRYFVNKNTVVLLILPALTFQAPSSTFAISIPSLIPSTNQNIPLFISLLTPPPPFCLVAASGSFSAPAYSGRLCEQGITLNTQLQYVVSYEIHWGVVRKLTPSVAFLGTSTTWSRKTASSFSILWSTVSHHFWGEFN